MKLIPYPHSNSLFEAIQVNGVEFAFTNKLDSGDYQLITNFVKCREYFNEFLMKNHHPDEFSFTEVYGFTYKHEEYPYQMQNPSIAIKLPQKSMYKTFVENLDWLNTIEDINDISKTCIVECDDQPTKGCQFILEFDNKWASSCLLFNIFTLLIKVCTFEVKAKTFAELLQPYDPDYRPSELAYINSVSVPTFNNLLNNLKELFQVKSKFVDGFDSVRGSYDVHQSSGILTFLKPKEYVKQSPVYITLQQIINKPATVAFVQESA